MQTWPPPGYVTQDGETDPAIERLQFDRWRALDSVAKLAIVTDLNAMCDHLAAIGERMRDPTVTDEELQLRVAARRIGADALARLLPDRRVG